VAYVPVPDPFADEYSQVDAAVVVDWPTAYAVAVETNKPLFAPDTRRIRHVIVPFDGYDAEEPE
jgi:hypothetical protein